MSRTTTIMCIAVWLVGSALAGCNFRPTTVETYPPVNTPARQSGRPAQDAEYLGQMAAQDDPVQPGRSAVDNALKWAEKDARVTEDLAALENENDDLRKENLAFRDQVMRMESDLGRAQDELADANEMLLQLQAELSKWKANVLGYRQETRQAQKAQMEALMKILTLLGGEVPDQASVDASSVGGGGS